MPDGAGVTRLVSPTPVGMNQVHLALQETIQPDGSFELAKLDRLEPEIIPGF